MQDKFIPEKFIYFVEIGGYESHSMVYSSLDLDDANFVFEEVCKRFKRISERLDRIAKRRGLEHKNWGLHGAYEYKNPFERRLKVDACETRWTNLVGMPIGEFGLDSVKTLKTNVNYPKDQ